MRKGLGFHNRHSPGVAALPPATNPPFQDVVMLLPGSGTNGAQNNTFLDSSANAFAITRNGNTTQGTFSPYGPNWSNFFDGTGDYLDVPDNAAFAPTTAFTIEAWVYPTVSVSPQFIACQFKDNGAASSSWYLALSGLTPFFGYYSGAGTNNSTTSSSAVSLNTWSHIAGVWTGTNLVLYVNGVQTGTAAVSATPINSSIAVKVGAREAAGSTSGVNTFNGYLSNVRYVNNTAVYTSNFTPPTAPLTAITNTSLLTCQSNRLIDNSSNAFAITRNGDVRVERFSPFAPGAAYDPAVIGGSGYFDGSGDYLTIADSATIRFGTGAFTVQGWVYRSVAGATHTIAAKGGASTGWVLQITSTNVLRFTDTTTNIDTTTTIPASTWTHVAVVRTGTGANGLKLYINAVDSATGTSSTNFDQTGALNIGADRSNANPFNGYISNLKYNVGTAETIVVPTSPISGGAVLLNFTNAGVIDNAMMNDAETVGDAQISNAQAKWGSTSISFDGTGDYLTVPRVLNNFAFGTGNFTVEMWVRFSNADGTSAYFIDARNASQTTAWAFFRAAGDKLSWFTGSTQFSSTATFLGDSTWVHIAYTRSGSTGRMFINGQLDSSFADSTNYSVAPSISYIGSRFNAAEQLNGYIQDLRVTKGVAVYTAAFSPPTAAFPLF